VYRIDTSATPAAGSRVVFVCAAKLWVEQFSITDGRPYYVNTCEHTSQVWNRQYYKYHLKAYFALDSYAVQWEKPEGFATCGEAYEAKWEEKWDAETGSLYWYNRRDHSRETTKPDDFDNTPL
jgi:hypothetical protein